MSNRSPAPYSLICVIAPHGRGTHIVRYAQDFGAGGGTIIAAHGTANNRWLHFLHLDDIRRDLVLMVVADDCAVPLLDALEKELRFTEKNSGIAFALPASHLIGTDRLPFDVVTDTDGAEICADPAADSLPEGEAYSALLVVVDEFVSEDVVDRIRELGAPGASTLAAYGSADKANLVFDVPVAPKKSSILVIADAAKAEAIAADLAVSFDLELPGKGILFAVPVSHVRGLSRGKEQQHAARQD